MRTIIDFNFCIGVIENKSHTLVIARPASIEDGVYIPASSICIYGEQQLINLRDVLLKNYPLTGEQK